MKDNKKLRITIDIVLILVASVFLFFGVKEVTKKIDALKVSDSTKFSRSYQSVGENNYEYLTEKGLEKVSDGVVFIGNPNDPWSQVLAPVLTELLVEYKVTTSYYYETDEDTPRILVFQEGKRVVELKKSDIYNENYDGIPIEYFENNEFKENFKTSLDVLTSSQK